MCPKLSHSDLCNIVIHTDWCESLWCRRRLMGLLLRAIDDRVGGPSDGHLVDELQESVEESVGLRNVVDVDVEVHRQSLAPRQQDDGEPRVVRLALLVRHLQQTAPGVRSRQRPVASHRKWRWKRNKTLARVCQMTRLRYVSFSLTRFNKI